MSQSSNKSDPEKQLEALRTELAELRAGEMMHQQTQEGLSAAERQLASIIHSAMDAIITINDEQKIILFNAAAETMFGCSTNWAIGQSIDTFIPQRFREVHGHHVGEFRDREMTTRRMGALGAIWGLRSNGKEFPIEASISKVKRGEEFFFTVILRDISERIKTDEALRRLKRQDELLLESAGEGIYGLDLDGNTTFVNKAAAQMIGWTPDELIDCPQHDFIHHTKSDGTPYPREECPIYAALKDGKVHRVQDEVFWRKDGTCFPVEYISTPILEDDGKIMGAVVTFKDITERLKMETQLRQTERLAEVGTLAAGMAHEIGTPMNVILGRAEFLMRKTSESSTKQGLGTIISQVERITKIMNQLLSFARRRPIERQSLELGRVVHEMLDVVRERLDTRNVVLEIFLDPTTPAVFADKDQMGQVVLNFIMNAIQAMPEGGTLRVDLKQEASMVKLEIADTGCGIPPENIPKLFTPFFSTKEVGEGTGLGLTVVHGIVQEHKGSIDVTSEVNKGSTFCLTLPIYDPAVHGV